MAIAVGLLLRFIATSQALKMVREGTAGLEPAKFPFGTVLFSEVLLVGGLLFGGAALLARGLAQDEASPTLRAGYVVGGCALIIAAVLTGGSPTINRT